MPYLLGLLNSEMRGNAPANIIRRIHVWLPRRRSERSKRSSVWEKRDAIRQGYRLTRVPVRDQFNRIPRDRTSRLLWTTLYQPNQETSDARVHLDHCWREIYADEKIASKFVYRDLAASLASFSFRRICVCSHSFKFFFSSLIRVSLIKNKNSFYRFLFTD